MLLKKLLKKSVQHQGMSVRDFYNKRNNVLVTRNARGLGDILMHRMLFEHFHRIMPDIKLTFACPKSYHDVINDHPYIDSIKDSINLDRKEYLISYDTSSCCIKHECSNLIETKHRADVWADHCGVILSNHNMHMPIIKPQQIQTGLMRVNQIKAISGHKNMKSPNILFTPIAYETQRTLTDEQIIGTVEYLRKKDYFVYSTHNFDIKILDDLNVPVLCGYNNHEFLSFVYAADYVVTTDTSVFHYSGGLKKPMVGIFTHVDGKYRGKYFDFVLVQKHRDNGNWPCGPCYNYANCTHPKYDGKLNSLRPCLTELTVKEICDGIDAMFSKWPVKVNSETDT